MSERLLPLLLDVRRATRGGVEAIAERQPRRFVDIVKHARTHSPYYRRLYSTPVSTWMLRLKRRLNAIVN